MIRDDKLSAEVQRRNIKDLRAIFKQLQKKESQFDGLIASAKESILTKQNELEKLTTKESKLSEEFEALDIDSKFSNQKMLQNCYDKISLSEAHDLELRKSDARIKEEIARSEKLREALILKKKLKNDLMKQLQILKLTKEEV